MTAAIQNTKLKRYKFISSKENIQGTHHPLISVGSKKRGVMMKAAIQNIKKTQVSIIKEKLSRYTPPTNQGWEEREEGSNDKSSHSKHKKETQVTIITEKHSWYTTPINQAWEEK